MVWLTWNYFNRGIWIKNYEYEVRFRLKRIMKQLQNVPQMTHLWYICTIKWGICTTKLGIFIIYMYHKVGEVKKVPYWVTRGGNSCFEGSFRQLWHWDKKSVSILKNSRRFWNILEKKLKECWMKLEIYTDSEWW